jgi:hypothetical protein
MSKLEITRYEGKPEWDRIDVNQKWSTWTIEGFLDGDVEIECSTHDGSNSLFLNQEELKQFIEFLQSKVK